MRKNRKKKRKEMGKKGKKEKKWEKRGKKEKMGKKRKNGGKKRLKRLRCAAGGYGNRWIGESSRWDRIEFGSPRYPHFGGGRGGAALTPYLCLLEGSALSARWAGGCFPFLFAVW